MIDIKVLNTKLTNDKLFFLSKSEKIYHLKSHWKHITRWGELHGSSFGICVSRFYHCLPRQTQYVVMPCQQGGVRYIDLPLEYVYPDFVTACEPDSHYASVSRTSQSMHNWAATSFKFIKSRVTQTGTIILEYCQWSTNLHYIMWSSRWCNMSANSS